MKVVVIVRCKISDINVEYVEFIILCNLIEIEEGKKVWGSDL